MNTTKNQHRKIETQQLNTSIEIVNFRDIEESELNAQEMNHSDFNRLVKNLKRDKVLTSAPLLMRQQGHEKYKCVSGHHRIRAAIKAGILEAYCIIIDEVDESTRVRLQLAHNDIHGTPNADIVKVLQEKLHNIDLTLVNLIDKDLAKDTDIEINVNIPTFRYINICLLENSRESLVDIIETLTSEEDVNYLIDVDTYNEITDLLTYAFAKGFKTAGQAFGKFLEIVLENKHLIER
jgi:hypothetical protein